MRANVVSGPARASPVPIFREREVGIHADDGRAKLSHERLRLAIHACGEDEPGFVVLVEGEIRHAGRALADAHRVGVGGHANHRHRHGRPLRFTDRASPREDDVASNRFAFREELSRRDLAQ